MAHGLKYKTLRWRYIEALEPPKVISITTSAEFGDGNTYAQITIRLHTRQVLNVFHLMIFFI